jgi:hypothetical protein
MEAMSSPITATAVLEIRVMARSLSLAPFERFARWRAGARQDHLVSKLGVKLRPIPFNA